jgi:hypothetical protein
MGCTEVGFVEFSGGLENARPLIFQSDCGNVNIRTKGVSIGLN